MDAFIARTRDLQQEMKLLKAKIKKMKRRECASDPVATLAAVNGWPLAQPVFITDSVPL